MGDGEKEEEGAEARGKMAEEGGGKQKGSRVEGRELRERTEAEEVAKEKVKKGTVEADRWEWAAPVAHNPETPLNPL